MLLSACGGQEEIPDGILSQEAMVNILIDIRIAEGKVDVLSVGRDSSAVLFGELERRIFEKHQLDSQIYRKSYQYYMTNAELYLSVNDIVLDSLKVRQQRLKTDVVRGKEN